MNLITLHDIVTAWCVGRITVVEALSMAQIETEAELREAAIHSGLLPVRPLTLEEQEHQELVDRILASIDEKPVTAT